MGIFKFKDKTSEDFGLVVQTPPTYSYPEKELTVTHIPGRNGDIIIDNKSYKNSTRTYLVGLKYRDGTGYYKNFQSILNWLEDIENKYFILEDSYDSDVYRLASFQSSGDLVDYFDQAGAMTITFNCKPQRFLKTGDIVTEYSGNEISIENEYKYEALPYIEISGIETDLENILMMSVIDSNNEAKSIITFSGYSDASEGSIVIDSLYQTATNLKNDDKYDKVSLNEKNFPLFSEGKTKITFGKYLVDSCEIPTYSSKILESQIYCLSEYKTYSALESLNQKMFFVRSFETIVDSKKKSYFASSVQSMISQLADSYTFESYNTILSNSSSSSTFTGNASDNNGTLPNWLILEDSTDSNGNAIVIAKSLVNGFFITSLSKDKKIRFVSENGIISDQLLPNSINTIKYYPSELSSDGKGVKNSTDNKYYKLSAKYDDVPYWLNFEVIYEDISPVKIVFSRKSKGYYWSDKTWLFGKSKWYYSNSTDLIELCSLSWSTSTKAFVSTSGLSTSTTSQYTYKHLEYAIYSVDQSNYVSNLYYYIDNSGNYILDSSSEYTIGRVYYKKYDTQNLPEYSPVFSESTDDRGITTKTEINPVKFIVKDGSKESTNTGLETLLIYPKEKGYYSYKTDKMDEQSAWEKKDDLASLIATISGTIGFEIHFIPYVSETDSKPDVSYSNETDWPEWLDPYPVDANGSYISNLKILNIYFKVLRKSMYRISESSTDDTGNSHKDKFKDLDINGVIPSSTFVKSTSNSFYVYTIDKCPDPYNYNRCYTVNGKALKSGELPEWLDATYNDIDTATGLPGSITYKVKIEGYFKWESNSSWIHKKVGDEIINISTKDDVSIYYMSKLPIYTDDDITDPNMKNLFSISIVQDSITGNPSELKYAIVSTGYYRVNNSTSWKYLTSGSILMTSKINEVSKIYHLRKISDDSLQKLKTKIKPRWWTL